MEITGLSDEELVQQIQDGNRSAFSELVNRHARRYYGLAYRMLSDKHEAEDMVQTALLKLWEHPEKWQPQKKVKFTTWFYRVVLNQCLDHLKKKRPLLTDKEDLISEVESGADDAVDDLARQERLEQALAELPERQRVALNLCFYEGLSNQEAADIMGVRLKALQSLLMRAKSTLRERFSIAGGDS